MKKIFILLILMLSISQAFGQKSIVTDIPCGGCVTNGHNTKVIDSISQIPTKIQFIVNAWINSSMTDFAGNIKFVEGMNINLGNWLGKDSIPQSRIEDASPKYRLFYQLSDTSLNIKAFCLKIELDSYGQVTYFGWPRKDYNKREKFVKPNEALELALKQCRIEKYKTDKYHCYLKYDPILEKMCWIIAFTQKTTGDKWSGTEEWIEIHIDATELKILDEKKNGIGWNTKE